MSVKGTIKEGAGYLEEEAGEALGNQKMADKGRKLRNDGLADNGEQLKTTKPGSGA